MQVNKTKSKLENILNYISFLPPLLFFATFLFPTLIPLSTVVFTLFFKKKFSIDNKFILITLIFVLLGMSVKFRDSSPKIEYRNVVSTSKNGFEIETGEFLRSEKSTPQKGNEIKFVRNEIHYHNGKKYIGPFTIVKELGLRKKFITFIQKKNHSNLLTALASGKRNFSEDEKWIYVNGGIMHLIAISAFHIGILFLFFNFFRSYLIAFLPFSTSKNLFIFYLFKYLALLYYIYMTGFSVPTVRASLFIMFYELFTLSGRNIHKLNIYLLSLIGTSILIPHSLESKSFILSAVAIFTVINIWNRLPSSEIVKITAISLFVSFILIPLTSEMNGIFPMNSPLTNLIAVPFMTVLIPVTMISQFIFPFCSNCSETILTLAEHVVFMFETESLFIVKHTLNSSLAVITPNSFEAILFFMFFLSTLLSGGKIKKMSALGTMLVAVLFFISPSEKETTYKIYTFPGKAKLIKSKKRTIIIEEKRYYFPEKYVNKKFDKLPLKLSSALSKKAVTKVDKIILKNSLPKKTLVKIKILPQFRETRFIIINQELLSINAKMENPDNTVWKEPE